MLAGERFSDRPGSVCPVIGAILRAYNDNTADEPRQELYRYAAEVVGTRAGFELRHRRATVALTWARARYEARTLRWRRVPRPPDADWSPELVAEYVILSLGRRSRLEAHTALLGLIDQLIALGQLVEHLPQTVENGGGGEEVLVAEVLEGGAPAGLELLSAPLDHIAPALGQRRQHDALVAV